MKKTSKFLMVALMLFSQLASPTLVIADTIEETLPPIETEQPETGENNTQEATYEFELSNEKDEASVNVNLKDIATNSKVDETKNYIVKSNLSFYELLTNGTYAEPKEDPKLELVTGTNLKDYTITFVNNGNELNGTYKFKATIYEADETFTEETSKEDLETFITIKDAVYTIDETEIDKNEIINLELLLADNAELTFDTETQVYTLSKDATNKVVKLPYNFLKANTDIKNTIDSLEYKINDTLSLNDYNFNEELDFSLMLNGTYKITLTITDIDGNEYTDEVTIAYNQAEENTELDTYFETTEDTTEEELFAKLVSTTVVDEETLTELEVDVDKLKDLVIKTPVDKAISDALTSALEEEVKADSFTTEDEGETYFGTILSDAFIGKLTEEDKLLTVREIYDYLANTGYIVAVVDKEGNEVSVDRFIETGMQLKVELLSQELTYTFMVLGDIDGSLVEESEVNAIIDSVLGITPLEGLYEDAADVNKDNFIDISDISKVAGSVSIKSWIQGQVSSDDITSSLNRTNSDIIRVGDTFKVSFSLKGFNKDYINALDGILNYDKEALSLIGMSTTDALSQYENINYSTSHFILAGEEIVDTDTVILTLTFKALKETTTKVSVDKLRAAMDGAEVSISSDNTLEVKVERVLSTNNDIVELTPSTGELDKEFNKDVYEYNLYVDSTTTKVTLQGLLGDKYASTMGFREYTLTGDVTVIYIDVTSETGDVKTYKVNVIKVYPKSSNTNLSKLEIDGYELDFDKNTLEYEITVSNDVNELDITAIAEDAKSRVNIYGNDSFEEGENIVTIVVTAEDGSQKTYTIKVNKEEAKKVVNKKDKDTTEEDDTTDNSSTEKTVIIILIILVVAGLLYLIFKKDEEEDNKNNKNQSKNSKK